MPSLLERLFRRRPSDEQLLNEGLGLAMDWGDDWLSPIQARLGTLHPQLSAADLDGMNAECQRAMQLAYAATHAALHVEGSELTRDALAVAMRQRYPWVNDENLTRLLRQGLYYAAKVGSHRHP